ncbi:hypothetical protein Nepgr_025464 [Nepenthes gracilis]|uniref:Uncharacterized protein n=1 Tax=Nepenthes gracilis TaxID=150966 RepID=A0AAD3T6S5_NEPGR|nr:hypothetical protein Nepgr_025464 [Nepenthes gracilis]
MHEEMKFRVSSCLFLSVLLLLPLAPSKAEAPPLSGGREGGSLAGRGGDMGGKMGFVGKLSFESMKNSGPIPGDNNKHHR